MLVRTGWPRMPARVFVALLASDSGRMTSAELAEQLQVSPAAISGAVRYLTQLGLASRQREPGTRRDIYVVHDDVWYSATIRRDQVFASFDDSLRQRRRALGPGRRRRTGWSRSARSSDSSAASCPSCTNVGRPEGRADPQFME